MCIKFKLGQSPIFYISIVLMHFFFSNSYFRQPLIRSFNVYTKFGYILCIYSQDVEQKQFLMSIKDRNSVANLRKMMLYNPNEDLANDNMHTKFG